MRLFTTLFALAVGATALSVGRGDCKPASTPYEVNKAYYDGTCFYPQPDPTFNLTSYLGKWYQVAGTPFTPTTNVRCISTDYSLNANGTITETNEGKIGDRPVSATGVATPAPTEFGNAGVFYVVFPGPPGSTCPGPNFFVQEQREEYAIVQTEEWKTLFLLSRKQNVPDIQIAEWIGRAGLLGTNNTLVQKVEQTDC